MKMKKVWKVMAGIAGLVLGILLAPVVMASNLPKVGDIIPGAAGYYRLNPTTGEHCVGPNAWPYQSLNSLWLVHYHSTCPVWQGNARVSAVTPTTTSSESCPTGQLGQIINRNYTVTYTSPDPSNIYIDRSTGHSLQESNTCRPSTAPTIPTGKSVVITENTIYTGEFSVTDPDANDPHNLVVANQPVNGSFSSSRSAKNFTLSYTPKKDWTGTDTVRFRVKDSSGLYSGYYQLQITVIPANTPPSINANEEISIDEDSQGTHTVVITDPDAGDSHTIEVVEQPKNGTLSYGKSGKNFVLTYKPNKDWNGTDTVKVRVKDKAGEYSGIQTVTVVVRPVNDPPVIQETATRVVEEGGQLVYQVPIVDPDIDMPFDSHTVIVTEQPSYGSISIDESTIRYTPNTHWNGTEQIVFKVRDEAGAESDLQTLTIQVTPVNNPPTIDPSIVDYTIDEDAELTHSVIISDPDIGMPHDEHTIEFVRLPTNGQVQVNKKTHEITYTPNADWYGSETIELIARDQAGEISNKQTVNIEVLPVPDAPTRVYIEEGYISVDAGKNSDWYQLMVVDPDLPNDSHTFSVSGNLRGGSVELDGSKLKFVAPDNYAGKITVQVTATDEAGLSISSPIDIFVRKMTVAGSVTLPAVKGALIAKDGKHGIVTTPLEGVISKYNVVLLDDSEHGVMLGDLTLQPGDTAEVPSGVYQLKGNELSLPIGATITGAEYSARIQIVPEDYRFPAVEYKVTFKPIKTRLDNVRNTYTQFLDDVSISVRNSGSFSCGLTTQQSLAENHDPVKRPVCLVEWEQMPDEAELSTAREDAGGTVPALTGFAIEPGKQTVAYKLYMYTGEGDKTHIETVTRDISVVSAKGKLNLTPTPRPDHLHHEVERFVMELKNETEHRCRPTQIERKSTPGTLYCNVEWVSLPYGFSERSGSENPVVEGYSEVESNAQFRWKVSGITPKGTRVEIAEQTLNIPVVQPSGPSIEVESKYKVGDLYAIPLNQKFELGVATVDANSPADLYVELTDASNNVSGYEYYAGSVNTSNKVSRVLSIDQEAPLYEPQIMTLKANYIRKPTIEVTETIDYRFVPSTGVEPYFRFNVDKVLDTETLPVTVTMVERNSYEKVYRPEYGEWDVQIYEIVRVFGQEPRYEPISENKPIDAQGQVSFDLNLENVSSTGTRLVAIATLNHDIPGYERVVESKQVYMTVLYGGEVTGEIYSKKFSGPAPYNAYFQYKPFKDNQRAARALGDTVWEVSSDDGQTWESFPPSKRPQFARTFEKGKYKIRAIAENKHSGVLFHSDEIELTVYNQPYLTVTGDQQVMVGDVAEVTVQPMLNGEELSLDMVTIEWSTDKGETFEEGTNEHTAERQEPGQYPLIARVKEADAPADDRYAWSTLKINPRFHQVRGPKVGLRGPRKLEFGKPSEIEATATARIKGLKGEIRSHFILPDGSIVEGEKLTYEPTEEDVANGRAPITFEAWFEGFEDKGGITSRTLNPRVWEYVWPSFELETVGTIRYAPTKLTLALKNSPIPSPLEDVTYSWTLPEGVEILKDRGNRLELNVPHGGDLEFSVTIRDSRGNESTAALMLPLEDAPEWVVTSEVTYSNEQMREPLLVRYRPSFKGGHPKDRISKKTFLLNGELLKSGGLTAKVELPAGTHTIGVEMMTRYGQLVTHEIEVDVAPNKPPVCGLQVIDQETRWRLEADCVDEDGVVRRHLWTVNGVETSGPNYKRFIKSRINEETVVQLVARDDSEGLSEPVEVVLRPESADGGVSRPDLPSDDETGDSALGETEEEGEDDNSEPLESNGESEGTGV